MVRKRKEKSKDVSKLRKVSYNPLTQTYPMLTSHVGIKAPRQLYGCIRVCSHTVIFVKESSYTLQGASFQITFLKCICLFLEREEGRE